jgi:hypothetical protein
MDLLEIGWRLLAGESDVGWVHFRAPDGWLYEITQGRHLREHPTD